MMQIKKKFSSLLLLISCLLILKTQPILAQETISENQSDVADQKSVIEEQVILPTAGVGNIFGSNIVSEEVFKQAILIQEQLNKSPYTDIIDSLTQEEKDLICKITYREAGNQSIIGQRAVMEVILNRLQSEVWPNDVKTILSTPGQFSTWKARNKITNEKLLEMKSVLYIVYTDNNTILPSNNYVYFNCANPGKESIKIEQHWFWI